MSVAFPFHVGAVEWRRNRRLHSFLRYEQQSIAVAFATALHHSSGTQNPQNKARVMEQAKYEKLQETVTKAEFFIGTDAAPLVEAGVFPSWVSSIWFQKSW